MKRMMLNRICAFLLFIGLIPTLIYAQNTVIKGIVIDKNKAPLPYANVSLLNAQDSSFIQGTTSKGDGTFELISKYKEGIVKISLIGYKNYFRTFHDTETWTVKLQEDSLELNEVVITSQSLRSFGNKDQIFLSGNDKKIGTNALETISHLPQFKANPTEIGLTTVDNKGILVLINGIRRTARDLMMLKPNDIKYVNYYSYPPTRYAHEGVGAVIDVVTKKQNDTLYTFYLSTKNGVSTGYGTNLASLTYQDSLNTISAAYFIDYRDLNSNLMDNSYHYENKSNIYQGTSGEYVGQFHIGQINYQRSQGKGLFSSQIEYRKNPGTQKYEQKINDAGKMSNSRRLKSDYDGFSVDLYYGYSFNKDKNISLNVLNTFYKSKSNNILNDISSQKIENKIDNKSYSLIAELLYNCKLFNGSFNLGAYYQYKSFSQTYNVDSYSKIGTHKEYFYGEYNKGINNFSYTFGVGVENNHYNTADQKSFDYWVLRPSLALSLQCTKSSSLRFTSSIRSIVPNVGSLTDSKVAIDENFFLQGNMGLKPYYVYGANLQYQYSSNDRKWYFVASVNNDFYPNKNVPIIGYDGENVIESISRIKNANEFGTSVSFRYQPVSWINFQPYYNYKYSKYDTPNLCVRHSMHNTGVSVNLLPKNWQMSWNVNFPMTTVNGDIFQKTGFQTTASILYKIKSISLGAEYIHNPRPNRTYANTKNFSFEEETKWNNFKNLIAVTFTCYLTKGKGHNQGSKRLRNKDQDAGLTQFNTAK